jgi:glycosyltransferase involved in cell wall biosynthesis
VRGTILLVTYFYPPSTTVGARRPHGLAKYLERLGYRVVVLTAGTWGARPAGEEVASEVVRSGDLMGSRLNWRRANFRTWAAGGGGEDYVAGSSRLAQVIVPDVMLVTWLPFALAAAARLSRRRAIDCAVTTSGPESAHLVGLALRRRGVPWVADIRDGWGFESIHSWPTRPQAALDERLERHVMTTAGGVTAVSEPIAADIRERFGVDARTVTNGYDPEEVPARTGSDELLRPDRHSLVHTGLMASALRSPRPVIQAIRLARERSPDVAARLELVLAGPLTAEERELIDAPDLGDQVRHVGNLPRPRALRLQREADSLLLLTSGNRRGEATGKLFEYLAAERPILVLGDESEAARIVHEAGAGAAVPADAPERIAPELERLVDGGIERADTASDRYSWAESARRLADVIESARRQRKTRE